MEGFLADISDEMIDERLDKMRNFLKKEHQDILKKLHQQSEYSFKQRIGKKINTNLDQIQKSYSLFQRACENILQSYFPLLCEDQFLSLLSQQQIMKRVKDLKADVEKYSSSLIKRLNRPKQEIQKEKKIKKQPKNRGKNSKKPLQSTVIMQKWLLQNFHDPYPSNAKKKQMAIQSKLSPQQVNNWFINFRERTIKKFVKKGIRQNLHQVFKHQGDQEYP